MSIDVSIASGLQRKCRIPLLNNPGSIRNRLNVQAAIANASTVAALRKNHGSFAAWLDSHHPRNRDEWVKLFGQTFKFTGGEIVGEFLLRSGYLAGAHRETCPVYRRIARKKPAWMRK